MSEKGPKYDFFKNKPPVVRPSEVKRKRKEEEPPAPVVKTRTVTKKVPMAVPEFSDLLQWCEDHQDDIEVRQFSKHCHPKFMRKRGGGGWSGAIKNTLAILRKMAKDGK